MFDNQNNNNTQFENQQAENSSFSASGVETVTGKKKGKKAAVAGGVAAVVVAGGCASAYAFSDTVQNQVKLRTMKPERYFAWVCENNSTEIAKKASADYEKSIKKLRDGQGINYNISYEMPDSVKSQLKDMVGDEELNSVIDNINSIAVDMNGAVCNNGLSFNIGAFFNDNKLAGIDYTLDPETMNVALRCPELTEKWLKIDASSLTEEITYDENGKKIIDFYKDFMNDPESILTPQQLEDEINRYVGIWNNTTKDVRVEKKEEIAISDITVNYTFAEIPVTGEMANEMAKNVLTELKSDEIVRGIVVDRLGVDADEFSSGIDSALDDVSSSTGGDDTATFKTYIDPTGQIRGISVYADNTEEFKFIIGKDGDQIRGEFNFGDEAKGTITATEGAGKSYTGSLEMTADEETVSFDFDGLKVVNEDLGYAEGTITAHVPDVDPISVVLTSDGKSQTISYDLKVEGQDYGRLNLSYSVNDGEKVSIPDESNALVLNKDNANDFKPEDYVSQEEVEKFLCNIFETVGIKDADKASEAIASDIFGGSSYDYDEFNEDEFDFDDEESDFDDEDLDIEDEDTDKDDKDDKDSHSSTAGSEMPDFKVDMPDIEIPEIPQFTTASVS